MNARGRYNAASLCSQVPLAAVAARARAPFVYLSLCEPEVVVMPAAGADARRLIEDVAESLLPVLDSCLIVAVKDR